MLEVKISQENVVEIETDLLVCVMHSTKKQGAFKALNKATDGVLGQMTKEQKFKGEGGQQLSTPIWNGLNAKNLLLLGINEETVADLDVWMKLAATATHHANKQKATTIAVILPKSIPSLERVASAWTSGAILATYQYLSYKSDSEKTKENTLASCTILPSQKIKNKEQEAIENAITNAQIVAGGTCAARDLVNEPPNSLTPEALAERSAEMADEYGLDCVIFDEKELEEKGFNLLLAVGSGSRQNPRLVHLTYRPAGYKKRTRLFLVGKGVTFDSGGLSLKPAGSMINMHADMAGAAAVFGAMQAIAQLQPNLEVHGIISTTENMTGSAAYRLNDVLTAYNGKTVEIHNTDAEGRLALGDALAYASEQKATHMIDLATLTGACLVALGSDTAAVMSDTPKMVHKLLEAAKASNESMWELPLLKPLAEGLKSNIADLKNVGSRYGGAISAGLFLKEFVGKDIKWAHLDIAGPAFSDKQKGYIPKGGTGYAVATLVEYVQMLA